MRVKRLTRGTGGTIRMTAHVTPGQTRGPAADVFPSTGPRVSRVGDTRRNICTMYCSAVLTLT